MDIILFTSVNLDFSLGGYVVQTPVSAAAGMKDHVMPNTTLSSL